MADRERERELRNLQATATILKMLNFCEIDFQVRHKIQRVLLRFALPGKLLRVLIRRLVTKMHAFLALNKQALPSFSLPSAPEARSTKYSIHH